MKSRGRLIGGVFVWILLTAVGTLALFAMYRPLVAASEKPRARLFSPSNMTLAPGDPVATGLSPADAEGRVVQYVEFPNQPVHVTGGLWATQTGVYTWDVPGGYRIRRVWTFAAKDRTSCFEGDLNILANGYELYPRAPHLEAQADHYEPWQHVDTNYALHLSATMPNQMMAIWTCRVTCGVQTRCHFGVRVELAPLALP